MKKIILIVSVTFLLLTSCANSGGEEKAKQLEVAVIIKATSSDFWQYVLVGAENYGVVHPGINVTTYGPATEAEIAEQVSILENVISKNPDVIVMASTSSDAANDAIKSARDKGIVFVAIDNKVKTEVDSFLSTNNQRGGDRAGEFLIKSLIEEQGVSSSSQLTGRVLVITSQTGPVVLESRNQGFIDYVKSNAPQLKFVETIDINNDMATGVSSFESVLDAEPDLVGVFANNNTGGNAVARVLEERNKGNIIAVAYDSDEAEVNAIRAGWLKALVVQDPYRMGYEGIDVALQKLAGLEVPKEIDTGAVVVTKANVDDSQIVTYLDPRKKKLSK